MEQLLTCFAAYVIQIDEHLVIIPILALSLSFSPLSRVQAVFSPTLSNVRPPNNPFNHIYNCDVEATDKPIGWIWCLCQPPHEHHPKVGETLPPEASYEQPTELFTCPKRWVAGYRKKHTDRPLRLISSPIRATSEMDYKPAKLCTSSLQTSAGSQGFSIHCICRLYRDSLK